MSEDKQVYDFNILIQWMIDNSLKDLHTCMPGKIVSFDPLTQLAEIQPLMKRKFVNDQEVDLPLCINCPVMFPRAGGFVITFPVKTGDECLVVFSERALDTWLQSGGTQLPPDTRKHSLSDAVAILGLYSTPNKLDAFSADGIEIKTVDGATYFRLEDGIIKIKGNVEIEGDVDITGDIGATGDMTGNNFVSTGLPGVDFNTHVHADPQGGLTGIPQ